MRARGSGVSPPPQPMSFHRSMRHFLLSILHILRLATPSNGGRRKPNLRCHQPRINVDLNTMRAASSESVRVVSSPSESA